ncbi:MAG: bifunctional phosphoglucose/phosphomannose isomerase [Actinomycetota bacterium]|nr:bifunctional phosphoglucose/phosphomannose isomerase [Actinomycetota bacterium]
MRDLSSEAIARVDSDDMLGDILAQPAQLKDALWRVDATDLSGRDSSSGLTVCGMGGSAIGGDLAAAAVGDRGDRPIRTVRDYSLGPRVGIDSLVLLASYSGDTEETVACYHEAGEAGMDRVVLTSGGGLAEAAREDGVPVIGVPGGMAPRAAVAYMVVAVLECAYLCGAAPPMREEVRLASALLEDLTSEWGPDADDDTNAKALARRLYGSVPIVYGADLTGPVAIRWKAQFNENVKTPAFYAMIPEANHNDLNGWLGASELAPLFPVLLDDRGIDSRVRRRIELTARMAADGATGVETVVSRGDSPLERVLSLVLLGDLISVYLAVLSERDPTPVEVIQQFKQALDAGEDLIPPVA